MAERGRLANLPEVVLDYRFHLQSGTARFDDVAGVGFAIASKACARRGLPPPEERPPSDSREQLERTMRRWICQTLLARNYTAARQLAWNGLRMNPRDWRMWAWMALSRLGVVGRSAIVGVGRRAR
jgi:hypothetical protein